MTPPEAISSNRTLLASLGDHAVACWLSMFTLHAIWPLVYMWAVSKAQPPPIKMADGKELRTGGLDDYADLRNGIETLKQQVESLEQRLEGKQS